jgi:uncharacterized protein YbcI
MTTQAFPATQAAPAVAPPAEERSPRGSLASSISNAVVRLFAEHLGRGPTKARTVISRDLISVVLEDTFTKAERKLIAEGHEQLVLTTRRAMQQVMRGELVAAVESLSERRVIAFLSDQQAQPDCAVETFVLEPIAHEHHPDEGSSHGST